MFMTAPTRRLQFGLGRCACAHLIAFERFDVLEPINDPAAQLDEPRTFAGPAPPFEGAVRNVPAIGEIDLVQMPE
jgi:hypothetical protein